MRMKTSLASVSLPLLVAGCTTVGPDYQTPEVAAASGWLEPADAGTVDPAWWSQFGDPLLVSLVERALTASPELAEAEARLAEARANRDAVTGQALPQVDASASATQNRITENGQIPVGNIPGFDPTFSLFDLGFDASWEIDFWGRRTRALQGAEARIDAAEAARDAVLVTLTAEIARNYVDLRAAQQDAAAARANAAAFDQLDRLTRLRREAGESSELEARRASADAQAAQGAIAGANTRAAAAAYRIAALMGVAPEEVVPQLREAAPIPQVPDTILAGTRSDLLRRRPDVRRAERELAAATADVGFATADLFPRFSLLGGLGLQSRTLDNLPDSGSLRYSVGPGVSWPIFSGGTVRARIRAADARADGAAARYTATVAQALADAESAVNRYLSAQSAQRTTQGSLEQQQQAFALARQRFDSGEDNRLALERARIELVGMERRLAQARAESALAATALFKALGGAWMNDKTGTTRAVQGDDTRSP